MCKSSSRQVVPTFGLENSTSGCVLASDFSLIEKENEKKKETDPLTNAWPPSQLWPRVQHPPTSRQACTHIYTLNDRQLESPVSLTFYVQVRLCAQEPPDLLG